MAHAYFYSMPVPPLANDRYNKTFGKDETIHHVVEGTRNQAISKAQTRVPCIGRGEGN